MSQPHHASGKQADTSATDSKKAADVQAQQDARAQDAAAAADDSTTIPHGKDTSRTAALTCPH